MRELQQGLGGGRAADGIHIRQDRAKSPGELGGAGFHLDRGGQQIFQQAMALQDGVGLKLGSIQQCEQ